MHSKQVFFQAYGEQNQKLHTHMMLTKYYQKAFRTFRFVAHVHTQM